MTSIVDSKAHFLKRCREVGLSDRAINALIANGFETLGTLAFGVGQAGVALVDGEFQTFALKLSWCISYNSWDIDIEAACVWKPHDATGTAAGTGQQPPSQCLSTFAGRWTWSEAQRS